MEDKRAKEIRQQIQATRRSRFLELISEIKSSHPGITRKGLSIQLGLAPTQLGQLLVAPKKKGSRGIGEVTARKIEEHRGLPKLWLDDIVTSDQQLSGAELGLIQQFRRLSGDARVTIERVVRQLASAEHRPDPQFDIETTVLHEKQVANK